VLLLYHVSLPRTCTEYSNVEADAGSKFSGNDGNEVNKVVKCNKHWVMMLYHHTVLVVLRDV